MDIADDLEMKYFSTGAKLIESIQKGNLYSIIFQDIYLENENGMDIARTVKELSPDSQIIFCTTSLDHAIDAFKVQAVDYLVKPCEEADIVKAFARVSLRINSQYSVPIVLNAGKEIHVFHPEKVIKVESDRHYTVIYQNRNLFHGSELLNVTARGAYEAIRGLEGYQSANYEEWGIETSLAFPRFLFPWMKKSFHRRSSATSEILFSYNRQNRPEFQRRIFTAAWRYKWNIPQKHIQYKVDAIDVNFISMPWISETFKHDYLDSVSNRNAILRYNYENLMIMKAGIGFTYSDRGKTIRLNFESAGNFLHLLSHPIRFRKNDEGQNMAFGIAYAQYIKGDADYTRLFTLDDRSNLAVHARLGVAYPYGNSSILPFEKRYFAGGSNSVRGWSVRSLGPGGYVGKDGRIDFINQTGDIKLELSAEMRSHLFWRFQSAIFVDAGNIWTIREYEDQPNGQFRFDTFLKQIAVAYGVGFRLNFDYFVIRLDMGMKAVNPAYTTSREHFPLVHPKFSRDHAFHFAVGFPF